MKAQLSRTLVWISSTALLWLNQGCSDGGTKPPPVDTDNCGHVLASGIVLDESGTVLASEWEQVVKGNVATTVGGRIENIRAVFLASDSSAVALPGSGCTSNRLEWEVADPTIAGVIPGSEKWSFTVTGLAAGSTTVRLRPMHETHSHYTTQPIQILVQ